MPAQDEEQTASPDDGAYGRVSTFLRNRQEAVSVYLKGFVMGSAATVPGVSGGTIALILGIYNRFIRALTVLDGQLLRLGTKLHRSEGRARFWAAAREHDIPFLLVLFAGIVTAVLTLARVISATLTAAPGPMFALFGGLIAASAFILFDPQWLFRPWQAVAAVAGFAIAFVVAGASGAGVFPETLPVVFVAAAIAISGMVLPGLSGSFLLLLLGQYEYLTTVAGRLTNHAATLASGTVPDKLGADITVVVTFGFGAMLGFFTTAYAVRAALERHPGPTFAFLVSLMLGALHYPVIRITEETEPAALPVAGVVLAGVAGAVLVFVFDYYTKDLEYMDADQFATGEDR